MTARIFLAALVAQTVIVVTGGAVRLTGSGLGCPTWPECAEGSYVPTPLQSEGVHKWIEFGNRLLTFVLALIIAAAIAAAWRQWRKGHPRGRLMFILALSQLLGIVGQAILGGITVLTNLHPIPVAGHFVLSIVLIAIAATLHFTATRPSVATAPEVRRLAIALTTLSALIVVIGTVVTGSGPHAGDERARRFGFDPRTVSWIHADLVIAFIVGLIALLVIARLTASPSPLKATAQVLLIISLSQGAIGYLQYFTGLPELLVGFHLLGACLVWIFSWRLLLVTSPRWLSFVELR